MLANPGHGERALANELKDIKPKPKCKSIQILSEIIFLLVTGDM